MRNPYDCFPASDLRRVEFRHHGLGMLQGYLPGSKKARVHIWHPALCADWRLEPLRAVHDHRYDLRSWVLIGSVTDISYDVQFTDLGLDGWKVSRMWAIVNAEGQKERGLSDDMVGQDLGHVMVQETGRRTYGAGSTYTIPRRAFHSTLIDDFAVTVVERSNMDDRPARVLGETGRSAIGWETTDLARQLVERAIIELEAL